MSVAPHLGPTRRPGPARRARSPGEPDRTGAGEAGCQDSRQRDATVRRNGDGAIRGLTVEGRDENQRAQEPAEHRGRVGARSSVPTQVFAGGRGREGEMAAAHRQVLRNAHRHQDQISMHGHAVHRLRGAELAVGELFANPVRHLDCERALAHSPGPVPGGRPAHARVALRPAPVVSSRSSWWRYSTRRWTNKRSTLSSDYPSTAPPRAARTRDYSSQPNSASTSTCERALSSAALGYSSSKNESPGNSRTTM